jgi:hypothetical protein
MNHHSKRHHQLIVNLQLFRCILYVGNHDYEIYQSIQKPTLTKRSTIQMRCIAAQRFRHVILLLIEIIYSRM